VAKKVIKVNKMSKSKPKAPTQLEQIKKDPVLRREAARRSHLFFFHAFLSHHAKYKTAPFQKELLALSQDQCKKFLIVEAFRGSAKSTIMALSLPIWSIIGIHEKKFVLIICKTQQQARQTMKNITEELTSNEFLKNELGPFDEPDDEWRQTSIVIPKYDARVTVVSLDTSVRGIKHGAHRPDLIIADDLEDLASVKSQEGRQKLYDQIFGDIVPMGDIATRVVVIGTRLHDDGIIMRMRQDIEDCVAAKVSEHGGDRVAAQNGTKHTSMVARIPTQDYRRRRNGGATHLDTEICNNAADRRESGLSIYADGR
jgi:hypothetical protein